MNIPAGNVADRDHNSRDDQRPENGHGKHHEDPAAPTPAVPAVHHHGDYSSRKSEFLRHDCAALGDVGDRADGPSPALTSDPNAFGKRWGLRYPSVAGGTRAK